MQTGLCSTADKIVRVRNWQKKVYQVGRSIGSLPGSFSRLVEDLPELVVGRSSPKIVGLLKLSQDADIHIHRTPRTPTSTSTGHPGCQHPHPQDTQDADIHILVAARSRSTDVDSTDVKRSCMVKIHGQIFGAFLMKMQNKTFILYLFSFLKRYDGPC